MPHKTKGNPNAIHPRPGAPKKPGPLPKPTSGSRPNRPSSQIHRLSALMPKGLLDAAFQYGARRHSRRWPIEGDVTFLAPQTIRAQLINASAGGLQVVLNSPLKVGELCVVKVRTTEGQETQEHARIVWSKEEGESWVAGLRFEQTAPATMA